MDGSTTKGEENLLSVELSIFQVFCSDREKHLLHKGHVEGLKNMEKELRTMFGLLNMYYEEFEGEMSVGAETLLDYYELKYPKSKAKDDITTITSNAFEIEVQGQMIDRFLDQLNEKYVATGLVNKLLPVLEGE